VRYIDIHTFLSQHLHTRTVIDVRTPLEFEKAHIPGAVNLPLLSNEQRHQIGICYKEKGQKEAVLLGYELVGPEFHLWIRKAREQFSGKPFVIYCWRGGLRSRIMAWVLDTSGFSCSVIQGGYKSYRKRVLQMFSRPHHWLILGGKTGMGKTEILSHLKSRMQVIDLEALAHHKGSAFGQLGLPPQPSQEMFENLLAYELIAMHPDQPIWVENESRMIGKVHIPDLLFEQIMEAPILQLEHEDAYRISRIKKEYGAFPREALEEKTRAIEKRLGNERMQQAVQALQAGNLEEWISHLLAYYDKTYMHGFLKRPGEQRFHLDIRNLNEQQITEELLQWAQSLPIKL